jgi:hypothetical protein
LVVAGKTPAFVIVLAVSAFSLFVGFMAALEASFFGEDGFLA